jgi:chromosome segregation ATPase
VSLIQEDSDRKLLLNYVQFSFVSSQLIHEYFCHSTINELDFELFEALKSRLFHDVFGKESEHYINRWRNQQKLITKQENEKISKENSELKNTLKQKEAENSELKTPLKQKETENLELRHTLKQREIENSELKNAFKQRETEFSNLHHLLYDSKHINIICHRRIISF